ncbi:MAG: 2-isopropylmalate synthase [Deltaproteobacteria bacterium]|nr:2-isopropylmalate synthase [Deltaproteobacteria bacterium]MBW2222859.1 2-isopropylmalate synthase [Deltaproteobacteria bacterium]MBW2547629.1 2-isopropylmalate synthase [Deltaproteobacteria bacterium]
MQPDHVRIFDTTLRDGEQSPGATMTSSEKLEVAKTLSRLGVDVIEAGFAAASDDDLRAVKTIAEAVGVTGVEGRPIPEPPTICSLARAHKSDIDKAAEAVAPAKRGRIHTFIATSPIHREHKLRMSKAEVLAKITEMVSYARSFCDDVEFSPEDAGRTEMEFLYEALQAAIEAGASTLNIPDTVGYTIPVEFGERIAMLRQNVPGIDNAVISVHCHDDLGMAVANSLSAVVNGARQVEVAVNGIGERAGNASLEEVVMALHVRRDLFGIGTHVDTTQLTRASRLVSKVTGMIVQPNKAIVGANAFAHEAGIHQDGMLKHEETYEIMRPETVGAGTTQLILGKHSGRHAFANRLTELGYSVSGDGLNKAFARFKKLADKKKHITDADLLALLSDELYQPKEFWRLDAIQVGCGTGMPTATVKLTGPDGQTQTSAEVGTGPVDAAYKAIQNLVHVPCSLLEYTVQSVTEGIDALGEVSVRVSTDDNEAPPGKLNPQYEHSRARVFHGHGAHTDVIVASAKAYIAAINRILAIREGTQAASAAAGSAA